MTHAATDLEEKLLNWMFNETTMGTAPSTLYIALHSDDPGNTLTNNELTAADYSRLQSPASDWEVLLQQDPGKAQNASVILFDEAASDWGTVTHASLWTGPDDSYNGLVRIDFDQSTVVSTGERLEFREGSMVVLFN